jgi:hypothetical protein
MSENAVHSTPFRTLSEYSKEFKDTQEGAVIDEFSRSTNLLSAMPIGRATGVLENRGVRKFGRLYPKWVAVDESGNSGRLHTEPYRDDLGIVEMWHEVDQKQQMFSPGHEVMDYEDERDTARAIALSVEDTIVYGNGQKQFKGIMSYFPNISSEADLDSPNFWCIDGNAKTDFGSHDASDLSGNGYSSMLMMVMGPDGIHMTYPLDSKTIGLNITLFDWHVEKDANGDKSVKRNARFMWVTGLSIAHRASVIRIANIDTRDPANSIPKLEERLYEAFSMIPDYMKGRVQIYTTPKVITGFRKYRQNRVDSIGEYKNTNPANLLGDIKFDQFIIHGTQAMVDSEAPVTAAE